MKRREENDVGTGTDSLGIGLIESKESRFESSPEAAAQRNSPSQSRRDSNSSIGSDDWQQKKEEAWVQVVGFTFRR